MEEKENEEKEQKLWGTGYFERLIIRIAPQNRPDLQGKIVEGKLDYRRGIAQLREHWDCNAWHMNCRECGDCPLIEHVDRVNEKQKLNDSDIDVAYASFGHEGLRNLLIQLGFPYNFSGPIYIPLRAEEYIYAIVSEGSIDVARIDWKNSKWFDCDYHLEIDKFFFITSDKHIEFWLAGLVKKQILIGLTRYARCLMGR